MKGDKFRTPGENRTHITLTMTYHSYDYSSAVEKLSAKFVHKIKDFNIIAILSQWFGLKRTRITDYRTFWFSSVKNAHSVRNTNLDAHASIFCVYNSFLPEAKKKRKKVDYLPLR